MLGEQILFRNFREFWGENVMEFAISGYVDELYCHKQLISDTKHHSTAPLKRKKDHVTGGLDPMWIEEKRLVYKRRHINLLRESEILNRFIFI
jgi:hypothetical protein